MPVVYGVYGCRFLKKECFEPGTKHIDNYEDGKSRADEGELITMIMCCGTMTCGLWWRSKHNRSSCPAFGNARRP